MNFRRLTLRQINENPTLMSDEVFVPVEEMEMLLRMLADPEQVHMMMLRGQMARISMATCAHTWGAKAVEEWNRASELRADLKTVSDVLQDYEGEHVWMKAQCAVEHIVDMRHKIRHMEAERESAGFLLGDVQAELRTAHAELFALRSQVRLARACMEANDHLNARNIFGPPIEEGCHDEAEEQAQGTAERERPQGDEGEEGHCQTC